MVPGESAKKSEVPVRQSFPHVSTYAMQPFQLQALSDLASVVCGKNAAKLLCSTGAFSV